MKIENVLYILAGICAVLFFITFLTAPEPKLLDLHTIPWLIGLILAIIGYFRQQGVKTTRH
jgi:uncharacterized membrane protein